MSGHSHAKTIRHQKEATDKQRGQVFSKMARLIWVAVKQGGANPETNSKFRLAIELARSYNMPNENIERAVKRAVGEVSAEKLGEISFEAYGPGGAAVIIEGITDNKNRALAEVKKILSQHNGKLVGEGGIKWMFERKGCIAVDLESQTEELQNQEKLELIAIESGAEDIFRRDEGLDVYTRVEDLEKVKKSLEEKGVKINSATLDWRPKEMVNVKEKDKEDCLRLFEALDESESVQEIYSNLNI